MRRSARRWADRARRAALAAALPVALFSCGGGVRTSAAGTVDRTVPPAPHAPRGPRARASVIRVLLTGTAQRGGVEIAGEGGEWRLYDAGGSSLVARGIPGRRWRVEAVGGGRLRAVREDGVATVERPGPFLARATGEATVLAWKGKRWRGDLLVVATDSGLLVVNQVGIEDYLRGVVPLEIGNRPAAERAAAEAQAVAARSYVHARPLGDARRQWDVVAGVMDQVYGGRDAERPLTDEAVRATRGEVLAVHGRVVNAPYSAVCGGTTAAPDELWRAAPESHLRSVDDTDPRTGRAWCEPSPRYRWSRSYTGPQLQATLARYLGARAPGRVRALRVARTTTSGRVGTLAIDGEGGTVELRGNDIRFTLRSPSGEILGSTYFTVEPVVGRDGRIAEATLRGTGFGHGVGMCQWGAIGRARAGHDYRRILQAYYPGATLLRVEY